MKKVNGIHGKKCIFSQKESKFRGESSVKERFL